jgi:hypothetical protein
MERAIMKSKKPLGEMRSGCGEDPQHSPGAHYTYGFVAGASSLTPLDDNDIIIIASMRHTPPHRETENSTAELFF